MVETEIIMLCLIIANTLGLGGGLFLLYRTYTANECSHEMLHQIVDLANHLRLGEKPMMMSGPGQEYEFRDWDEGPVEGDNDE